MKKIVSLCTAAVLCLSLLPSQVLAASVPEPDDPVIQVDPLDPDEPDDPDPAMPASAVELPEKAVGEHPVD